MVFIPGLWYAVREQCWTSPQNKLQNVFVARSFQRSSSKDARYCKYFLQSHHLSLQCRIHLSKGAHVPTLSLFLSRMLSIVRPHPPAVEQLIREGTEHDSPAICTGDSCASLCPQAIQPHGLMARLGKIRSVFPRK